MNIKNCLTMLFLILAPLAVNADQQLYKTILGVKVPVTKEDRIIVSRDFDAWFTEKKPGKPKEIRVTIKKGSVLLLKPLVTREVGGKKTTFVELYMIRSSDDRHSKVKPGGKIRIKKTRFKDIFSKEKNQK